MITDKLLRISEDQDIGALGNNAVEYSSAIDLGVQRDVAQGEDLYFVFTVTESFAGLTDLTVAIISDTTDDTFGSGSVVQHATTAAILTANLTAGTQFALKLPPIFGGKHNRYLGARYTCNGDPTAGMITADVVLDVQDGLKFYASGFTTDFVGIPTP